MSIVDIRSAFDYAAQGRVRCVRALMVYCDENKRQGGAKRDHRLLTLQLSDGTKHEILLKPGETENAAAAELAQRLTADARI